jgi:hypothetical protein
MLVDIVKHVLSLKSTFRGQLCRVLSKEGSGVDWTQNVELLENLQLINTAIGLDDSLPNHKFVLSGICLDKQKNFCSSLGFVLMLLEVYSEKWFGEFIYLV